ncbi:MAG: hypothetical protein ACTS27_11465 [Phycisphaerales bacterium]
MFDRVIMIDWSARNAPSPRRPSKDAIWVAHGTRDAREDPAYFRTRRACEAWLAMELARAEQTTLVGFDFPFGYPAHDNAPTMPVGRALCAALAEEIGDDERNRSNRFETAARLNARFVERFGGEGPFWGRPVRREVAGVSFTKPRACELPEFRTVERFQRRAVGASPKSAWQLIGAGSVGSQALLGLAAIGRLLRDDAIASRAVIWPFETRWGDAICAALRPDSVVFAEIYPSLFNDRAAQVAHAIHDARQVVACRDAALDAGGADWIRMFTAPTTLSAQERREAESIEGWILGVG